MATERPPERKAMNLRLPLDLYAELEAFASRTERSLNGAAVYAIRSFLAGEQPTPDPNVHLR